MKAIIIHAWGEGPDSCWYSWLKAELEKRGFDVQVPAMPDTDEPKIEAWVSALKRHVPQPDEQTVLIGHSIGCQTILRYLAALPNGVRTGRVVFAAPWTQLTGLEPDSQKIAQPWLDTPIDWAAAKQHAPSFTALFSDDDEWVPVAEEATFKEKLGAITYMLHAGGHFDQQTTFPELLDAVLR